MPEAQTGFPGEIGYGYGLCHVVQTELIDQRKEFVASDSGAIQSGGEQRHDEIIREPACRRAIGDLMVAKSGEERFNPAYDGGIHRKIH